MNDYVKLPLVFLKFWYIDALGEIFRFFASVNSSFFQLFSLPEFFRTYFEPLKNEYREGLVGFSRGIGIVIKTFLICADLLIFSLILFVEIVVIFSFFLFPIVTIGLLFV